MPIATSNSIQLTKNQTINVEPFAAYNTSTLLARQTVILIGRYTGSASGQGRILASGAENDNPTTLNSNTLVGTDAGSTVVAFSEPTVGETQNGYIFGPSGSYDTTYRMYALGKDGNDYRFWLNGSFVTGSIKSLRGFRSVGVNSGSFFGGTDGSRSNSNCEIGQIIMYNKLLSNSEITQIYNNFTASYAI